MFCDLRISIVVLMFVIIEMKANLINVALLKETTDSSEGTGAALAVDGNTNQDYRGGSCTHIPAVYQQYWEVDLGTSYVIDFIKVYNRRDCCPERLINVEVSVSTDHVTYERYGYHRGTVGSTYAFYPENPVVVGRWVKITLLEVTNILTVCEVEIMSNMTYRRDYLQSINNVEGTGNITASIPVVSESQCVFLCVQEEACHSVNVRQDMTSSTQIECQLLNHVSYSTTSDENVKFWRRATNL